MPFLVLLDGFVTSNLPWPPPLLHSGLWGDHFLFYLIEKEGGQLFRDSPLFGLPLHCMFPLNENKNSLTSVEYSSCFCQ